MTGINQALMLSWQIANGANNKHNTHFNDNGNKILMMQDDKTGLLYLLSKIATSILWI
jgi:hypothetical protein